MDRWPELNRWDLVPIIFEWNQQGFGSAQIRITLSAQNGVRIRHIPNDRKAAFLIFRSKGARIKKFLSPRTHNAWSNSQHQ